MLNALSPQLPLWVTYDQVPKPDKKCRYTKIGELVGDWRSLAKPLEAAFAKDRGRPMDPVTYLKIFLIGALENICYDTELAAVIKDSIRLRQFLGIPWPEATPDHSSISWARAKIATRCDLEPLLEAIVMRCLTAGLGGNGVMAVDATLLKANASMDSLRHKQSGKTHNDHFRYLKKLAQEAAAQEAAAQEAAAQEAAADGAAAEPAVQAEPAQSAAPAEAVAPAESAGPAEAAGEAKPEAKGGRRKLSNAEFTSRTDPDARIAKKRNQPAALCYQSTTIVNADHIIMAVGLGHADQGEVEAAGPVVAAGLARLGAGASRAPIIVADMGYDAASFHQHVAAHGGVPLTPTRAPYEAKPEPLRKAQFVYLEELDAYRCPAGKLLTFRCREPAAQRSRYQSEATDCAACPLRQLCLSPEGLTRTISRADGEASRDGVRALAATPDGQAWLRQRMGLVEGPFGYWKEYGGLSRINCRGRAKAKVKLFFGAVTWNLLRLMHHVFPDPSREGSKQRRAAHQEQRRQNKAKAAKEGAGETPVVRLHSPLAGPVQALWRRFSRPAAWCHPFLRSLLVRPITLAAAGASSS